MSEIDTFYSGKLALSTMVKIRTFYVRKNWRFLRWEIDAFYRQKSRWNSAKNGMQRLARNNRNGSSITTRLRVVYWRSDPSLMVVGMISPFYFFPCLRYPLFHFFPLTLHAFFFNLATFFSCLVLCLLSLSFFASTLSLWLPEFS